MTGIRFHSATSHWLHVVETLLDSPPTSSRDGDCREQVGWSAVITRPQYGWVSHEGRKASLGYGFAELFWYLRGDAHLQQLGAYAPGYERFTNNGLAMGAYGYRWRLNPGIAEKGKGQSSLFHALELLKERQQDRRAVVSMWDSGDVWEARRGARGEADAWRDIPCTLNLQFILRGGLHLITTMRSNDAWLGTIYDVFCFTQLQLLAAAYLETEAGNYHHNVGSMHLYERDADKARQALDGAGRWESWASPTITREEAVDLLQDPFKSVILGAEEALRARGLESALSDLPSAWTWTAMALMEMARHLQARKAKHKGPEATR